MAISYSDRFGLTLWSSGSDEFSRAQMTDDNTSIGDDAAMFLSGSSATPPTAATSNTKAFYWDTTNSKLYFRGAGVHGWEQIFPVLPAGHIHADLQPLDADLTSLAGLSTTGIVSRTASNTFTTRSISVSGTGLSITNGDGVSGNISISLTSSSSSTSNTIVIRDSNAQFEVGTPTGNSNVTTKLYVDNAVSAKADSTSVYTKTNIENAQLYQYGNITSGGTDTSGTQLPTSGSRTTRRIYVQSNDPSTATGYVGVTGDIWFQI